MIINLRIINKRIKGFTLVEVLISMMLIVIVFGIVSFYLVYINKYITNSLNVAEERKELFSFHSFMMRNVAYSSKIKILGENEFGFIFQGDTTRISYDGNNLLIKPSNDTLITDIQDFKTVENVFMGEKLIKGFKIRVMGPQNFEDTLRLDFYKRVPGL